MNTTHDDAASEATMISSETTFIPDNSVQISHKHQVAVVLAVLTPIVGIFGVDRMATGRVGLGILKLITFGGFFVWGIVDYILFATGKARDGNGNPIFSYGDGTPMMSEPGEPPARHAIVSDKHFTAVVLSALLGWLGIDRMYTGRVGLGILKLITLGGFGVWFIVDLCLMGLGKAKDRDGTPLIQYL